jgi:16S rRNA (guanine527-N7)-methyltransferase
MGKWGNRSPKKHHAVHNTQKEFRDLLKQTLLQHGFPLGPVQLDQFVTYWLELKRWNSQLNLTSICADREIIMKHFLDSLSVLRHFSIKLGDSVIDIGTGAGFPGIPIKIYIPGVQLVLLESSSKKASFLRFLISQLSRNAQSNAAASWTHVRIITQRAEECTEQNAYDWVLTRYVASLEDSLTYCLPLLKRDGTWIAYKSCNVEPEIQSVTPKLRSLGGHVQSVINSHIPELNRTYVAIRIKELY